MTSNVSQRAIYQTEIRLTELARKERYEEGLAIIDDFLNKYGVVNEILVQKAFFLYHYAAYLKYNHIQNHKKKALIKKLHNIDNRNLLNVRIYLAQIYAMTSRVKEAKNIARQTFKYHPSDLTAERVADVYLRLNDLPGAVSWYKTAIKLAKKTDEKSMAQIGLAITYKKIGETSSALEEAHKALQLLKHSGKNKNIILLKQSVYAHFPQLKG